MEKIEWSLELPGKYKWRSSPTAGDGKIYIMNHNGDVLVISASMAKFFILLRWVALMMIILDLQLLSPGKNSSFEPMKFCIASNRKFIHINNFISHPPHPRRAVPANLPPGAFFLSGFSLFYFI